MRPLTAWSSPPWSRTNSGQSSDTSWPRFRMAEITWVFDLRQPQYVDILDYNGFNKNVPISDTHLSMWLMRAELLTYLRMP